MKKVLLLLIIFTFILSVFNVALAGGDYSAVLGDDTKIIVEPGDAVIIGDPNVTYKNLQIQCKEGTNLTIRDLNINNKDNRGTCAISFEGKGNTLVLEGNNSLISGRYNPGIRVENDTELNIKGGGYLWAYGGYGGAGIGGGDNLSNGSGGEVKKIRNCGAIVIESGNIYAQGGDSAACIGGGSGGDGGIIKILGGAVTANKNYDTAGIGGGSRYFNYDTNEYGSPESSVCDIEISGGKVKVTGNYVDSEDVTDAAAIGYGHNKNNRRVVLSGNADIAISEGMILDLGEATVSGGAYLYCGYDPNHVPPVSSTHHYVEASLLFNNSMDIPSDDIDNETVNIVDGKGEKHQVGLMNKDNSVGAFLPEGTYYFEDLEGNRRTASFEVKEDIRVSLEFYSVIADAYIDLHLHGEDTVFQDNKYATDLHLYDQDKQEVLLNIDTKYYDSAIFVNGERWGLLNKNVKVRPGNDTVEIKVVAGDGKASSTYKIHTISPFSFRYSVWYWIVIGLGAAILTALVLLLRKKLFRRRIIGIAVSVILAGAFVFAAVSPAAGIKAETVKLPDPDPAYAGGDNAVSNSFAVTDDYIFYSIVHPQYKNSHRDLYRFDKQTKESVLLAEHVSPDIAVYSGRIYYFVPDNNEENPTSYFYSIGFDGKNKESIFQEKYPVTAFFVDNGKIYLSNSEELYVYRIDSGDRQKLMSTFWIKGFVKKGGSHYVVYKADPDVFGKIDTESDVITEIPYMPYGTINGYEMRSKDDSLIVLGGPDNKSAAVDDDFEGGYYSIVDTARYYQYFFYREYGRLKAYDVKTGETYQIGVLSSDFERFIEAGNKLYAYFKVNTEPADISDPDYDVLVLAEISVRNGGLAVDEVIRRKTWEVYKPADGGL